MTPAPFRGFTKEGLSFLAALADNNSRDWFEANRATYEQHIKQPLAAFVLALSFACEAHGLPLTGDPKRSVFRINRDVRFSRDKSPYKTNASCVLSRDGGKQGTGILYVQIGGQDGAFMALGFYAPEPDDLAALRHAVVAREKEWVKTVAALKAEKLELSQDAKLARLPRGFEAYKDSPLADTLRLKNFVVSRKIPPKHVHGTALIDDAVAFAQAGLALLIFGRNAIDTGRGARS